MILWRTYGNHAENLLNLVYYKGFIEYGGVHIMNPKDRFSHDIQLFPCFFMQEITYIPVDYICIPYYDDHFDITNERLLLGKALYNIGKEMDNVVGRSLQLIGLGLWEKFSKANGLLEKWTMEVKEEAVVTEDAVSTVKSFGRQKTSL